jgi:3-deoxy-D-manno-octulosonate 8-phosphate phosphatase (KDO 8-P phosphatase)
MSLIERCQKIELLVVDVDGVLTDGSIIYTDHGAEIKAFHVRDGAGLKLWLSLGKKAAIITGRRSALVDRRGAELGMTAVIQGADDKGQAFRNLLADQGLTAAQAAFVGDDVVDLPVLRQSGLAVAVADACLEAREQAHYVCCAAGGRGAVREVIEVILKAQGRWQDMVARMSGKGT